MVDIEIEQPKKQKVDVEQAREQKVDVEVREARKQKVETEVREPTPLVTGSGGPAQNISHTKSVLLKNI